MKREDSSRVGGSNGYRVTQEHWLEPVRRLWSPNQDERPRGSSIDLLVLHGISLPPGSFGGPWIERLFTNRLDPGAHPSFPEISRLRVSSHLLLRRDGTLFQYVPFDRRAWHAGASRFEGREQCNDFSIGVEIEGADNVPYSEAQYVTLIPVCRALISGYPGITPERIVGHCDIAPGRKTDPGPAFDWERLKAALRSPTTNP